MSIQVKDQIKTLSEKWKVIPIYGMSNDDRRQYQYMAVNFYNSNPHLTSYIQEPEDENSTERNAWTDVGDGMTNTYLVVDINLKQIVFYFSLSCGLLYSDLPMSREYSETEMSFLNTYHQALQTGRKKFTTELRSIAPEFGLSEAVKNLDAVYKDSKRDKKHTKEEYISQLVVETYPAIEMTHFCKNDSYYGMPVGFTLKTGAYVFWECVFPEIRKLSKKAAARYLYLFAAEKYLFYSDSSRKLLQYYQEHLRFSQITPSVNKKILKPSYDYECISMIQEISQLAQKKKEYYSLFQ